MTVIEQHTSAATLKEVGAELAEARAAQNHSVADVCASLRIVPNYIEAIERGDIEALPAATYAIGYVRSYAGFVGLDADAMCLRLRESLSEEQVRPEYEFIENKMASRSGAGRMALIAVTLMMVGYGGWYAIDTGLLGPESEPVPASTVETVLLDIPAEEEPGADADVAEDTTDTATGAVEGTTEVDQQDSVIQPESNDETATEVAPTPEISAQVANVDTADDENRVDAPQPGQAVAHNRNPNAEMVIKALATSWVEISRPDGSIVSSWLMREGDEYIVPGDQDIYLTVGNAGGLEVEIEGRDPKKLGEWGETVSELPLDPTLLIDRY